MRTLGNKKKRLAAVAATVAAVLIGGGVATAYWTTTGSGSDSASISAGTGTLTYTASSPITGLFPGAEVDFDVDVNNTTGSPIQVGTVDISVTDVTGEASGVCNPADFVVDDIVLGANVPAGTSTLTTGSTITMTNTNANQNACKGATVVLGFSS